MSGDVQSTTVNVTSTTVVPHHDNDGSSLTPGQIAAVTIGTSFGFFISIMFIICIGEFVQYNKRKRLAAERKKNSGGGVSYNYDSEVRSGSQFDSSQSDYTSSFQARQSMQAEPVASTSRARDSRDVSQLTDSNIPTRLSISNEEAVTLMVDKSLSDVQLDCDNPCDNRNGDIVMLPLIGKQCDEVLDIDSEIFCDGTESKEMYRLEADV